MPTPTQINTDSDRSVTMNRFFDAPRHVIWHAFTDPAVLSQWLLGPPGWAMALCEIALHPGGGYHWRWQHPQTGKGFGFRGTYLIVEPGKMLVDKQTFDESATDATGATPSSLASREITKNTVAFRDELAGCRVTTTVRYPDPTTRDMVLSQGLPEGMEASYRRLDEMLLRAAA